MPEGSSSGNGDELFRVALEAAPTGMLMIDSSGFIMLVNAQVERLFGYDRSELIGQSVEILVPERFRAAHPGHRAEFFREPRTRSMGSGELFGLRKDGSEVSIEIGLTPVRTREGNFVLSAIVDVSERRRTIEQLRERTAELTASVRERDALLQEVHHRVKNNLQLISSLINMQMRRLESGGPREALAECRQRVEAISLIHQTLYQSRNYARVPFSDYVRILTSNTLQIAGSGCNIELQIDSDPVWLPVDRAISCGLLINELIANVVRQASGNGHQCHLHLTLRSVDNRVRLVIDGPSVLDRSNLSALGLQLIENLSLQLEGNLSINEQHVAIEFPLIGEQ
ncbi:PAS domain S-box-containing protein [Povalibacter uvarum]|uniref:histidine kinase n=1 Tax=Povalibacter uvarum TaxID=732238 RepID=A0A841HN50_9GAMM|nr:histidine kinase dimerization/phosphoacceptor domain -containing protein [Povalibacter uvarum]MBB6093700.1 PAS domain S-box-containing protein [Povalibacter uvarum]